MINKNTVFILGAGASCVYGYPTGYGLKNEIISLCSDESALLRLSTQTNLDASDFDEFGKNFRDSPTESIDLYLSRNHQYRLRGKTAICYCIHSHEEKGYSPARIDNNVNWFSHLFNKMTETLTTPDSYRDFNKNKISFITFNYDRALEYFFYHSLKNTFTKANNNQISEICEKISITHVYGMTANLPFQEGNIRYGAELSGSKYLEMADNINVIGEERNANSVSDIKDILSRANRIYFLGFGYAPENLEALGFPEILKVRFETINPSPIMKTGSSFNVYGTALDAFENEIVEFKNRIFPQMPNRDSYLKNNIFIDEDCDCKKLLRKYPLA